MTSVFRFLKQTVHPEVICQHVSAGFNHQLSAGTTSGSGVSFAILFVCAAAAALHGKSSCLPECDSAPTISNGEHLAMAFSARAKLRASSVAEVGRLPFSFLTPEFRRNVFFIYEKRLRIHSPPEKVFDYFSSVQNNRGTFMTSLDLMRAAIPVFQPASSSQVRSGFLGGEQREAREQSAVSGFDQFCPDSDFFKLFDTDGDGLISFQEYLFFVTLLSLPESQVKSTFQDFDLDGNGHLCRREFIEMMKVMRLSTGRAKATGFRTGMKPINVDNLSAGLLHYFFGDPDKDYRLSLLQFETFLHKLRSTMDELEFKHYDFTGVGSISLHDFGYSLVAGADVVRIQYLIERASKLASSNIGISAERVSKEQFLAFCRLLKHGGTNFQEKVQAHVINGAQLDKLSFMRFAKECGEHLSEKQIDVLFFIFDIDGDGLLSPEELLHVICRWH